MCDRKPGFFFLSCDSLIFLSDYDSVAYNMSEKIFCLGLRLFDFLLDRNAGRFSLHLADSVAKEFQKTKCSVIVRFLSPSCEESQI